MQMIIDLIYISNHDCASFCIAPGVCASDMDQDLRTCRARHFADRKKPPMAWQEHLACGNLERRFNHGEDNSVMIKPRALTFSLVALVALVACSDATEPASTTNGTDIGDAERYTATLDIHDFMELVLEPVADALWRSAGWIDDQHEGYYELYPTTDEGWLQVQQWAAQVVEAGNAMAIPQRDEGGPWLTYSRAMSEVGLRAIQAARTQHEEDLFQAGAQLYSVCNACHQAYNPELSRFFD